MADKPKAFAVTREEGGYWEPFIRLRKTKPKAGWNVFAIMFDDGSIWDAVSGWRSSNVPNMTPDDVRALWAQATPGKIPALQAYVDAVAGEVYP